MRSTVHILRVKNGLDHHGIVEVRRDRDGDIFCRLEDTMLERIDCGDYIADTAYILEIDGELYEGGRKVTLKPEEYKEAEKELTRLENSSSSSILSPITTLRPENAFIYSNQGGVRDLA